MPRLSLKPPIKLSSEETKLYKLIVKFLNENSAYLKIDSFYICRAVQCWSMMEEAQQEMARTGMIQLYESGASAPSAAYTIFNHQQKQFDTYCRRLGLNQFAREQLITFKKTKEDEKDPFAQMVKMREKRKLKAV